MKFPPPYARRASVGSAQPPKARQQGLSPFGEQFSRTGPNQHIWSGSLSVKHYEASSGWHFESRVLALPSRSIGVSVPILRL